MQLRRHVFFSTTTYALCLMETLMEGFLFKRKPFSSSPSPSARILGYVWVLAVFFVLVPAWKYPLIYHAQTR